MTIQIQQLIYILPTLSLGRLILSQNNPNWPVIGSHHMPLPLLGIIALSIIRFRSLSVGPLYLIFAL